VQLLLLADIEKAPGYGIEVIRVKGMYRSRSAKRRFVRTPKRTNLHFKKKKKGKHICAECGAVLHGVSRKKGDSFTPSRRYGGYICHKCLRKRLVESVRA
jgi:large subunit ribosomal protein L34e